MQGDTHQHDKVYQVRIDDSGRIVIPAESKLRHACQPGESLVVVEGEDGSISIKRYEDAVREVQNYFTKRIPSGVSLVDELIAERRGEVARE